MIQHDLTIHRGARFDARGWVALDEDGLPRRDITGMTVVAKVRRFRWDPAVLHTLATSAVLVPLPEYGGQLVAMAQIDEMSPAQTAALDFARGVFDVIINDEPLVTGRVVAPRVVSR